MDEFTSKIFNETNDNEQEEEPRISNDSGNANSTSNKENLKPIIKNYSSSHMSLDQKLGLFREEKIYSKEEELRSMKEQYSQLLKDSRNISKFSLIDDNTLANQITCNISALLEAPNLDLSNAPEISHNNVKIGRAHV